MWHNDSSQSGYYVLNASSLILYDIYEEKKTDINYVTFYLFIIF